MNTQDIWNRHYTTDRSRQRYPDENLVRILSRLDPAAGGAALDYGFGSGRHLPLLVDFGYAPVCGLEVSRVAWDAARSSFPSLDLRLLENDDSTSLPSLPFADDSMSLIVCWGVLHYLNDHHQNHLLQEFKRLLRPEGALLGTLRSDRDTHFAHSEVSDSSIKLYSQEEAEDLLAAHFSTSELGHMERTPLGKPQLRISHWFFLARP